MKPTPLPAPLFTFVVVADTHVNESDDTSTSPCLTNRLANERARFVFHDIAAMDPPPSFVIHLGDIVHPVPSLPAFHDAVALFKEIVAPLAVPLHVIPGNHDVGDKRIDWMPADQVCPSYLEKYRAAFGADWFAFDHGGVRFVLLNSLLLNSGLPDEQRQREWLEAQIDGAGDLRVFLFMHYPPYIYRPDERGNYDNVDEPARSWLLGLASRPNVEAVFAGHVHNFWYDRIGDAEFYMLPSTAFMRHDFAEFYRVAPSVEFGRGDVEKFGYFIVDVHADGHVAYSVRTMGERARRFDEPGPKPLRRLAHPKTSTFDRVGVELRHPWTESMQITSTGGVQEFGRKWARNDYPLLALWEMGARLSKIPDLDLIEPESRQRMQLLARLGHRYLVTTLGVPGSRLPQSPLDVFGVEGFEVNITLAGFAAQRAALNAYRRATGLQILYSKILTYDDSRTEGQHFSHFVKAGFTVEELEPHREMLHAARAAGDIDGITVRLEADQPLLPAAALMMEFAERTDCLILASLKLSGPGLAIERDDDRANVAAVARALILSRASPRIRYVFDTFMDVDRGYFPRHGFIDRRFNPRPAAHAFTTLTALLPTTDPVVLAPGFPQADGTLAFSVGKTPYVLVCEETTQAMARLLLLGGCTTAVDLVADRTEPLDVLLARLAESASREGESLQVILVH